MGEGRVGWCWNVRRPGEEEENLETWPAYFSPALLPLLFAGVLSCALFAALLYAVERP